MTAIIVFWLMFSVLGIITGVFVILCTKKNDNYVSFSWVLVLFLSISLLSSCILLISGDYKGAEAAESVRQGGAALND